MPDETEIDFEKLQAGDGDEWERAWLPLYNAGMNAAATFHNSLGNVRDDDAVLKAMEKAHKGIARIRDFTHLCKFIAKATNSALKDELDRLNSQKHGGGKLQSLEKMGIGIVPEGEFARSRARQHRSWMEPEPIDAEEVRKADGNYHKEEIAVEKHILPDIATHRRLLVDVYEQALMQADKRYSRVVWDWFIEGLKHKEIAKKYGISVGSVGMYMKRGLDELAELMPEGMKESNSRGNKRIRSEKKAAN